MSRHLKRYGNCAYCGEYGKLTRDHVIPKCLFPDDLPLPGDIPRIHACRRCNEIWKSEDDSYLRDVMVLHARSAINPLARRMFPKFVRALHDNKSQLANDLRRGKLIELVEGPPGMYIGKIISQETDERITRIFSTIARGLYNFRTQAVLPTIVPIKVTHIGDIEYLKHVESVILNGYGSSFSVGDGSVFQCLYVLSPIDPTDTVWVPIFYSSVQFLILTGLLAELRAEDDNLLVDNQPVI